ncbi:13733_t:CDS:2, partial [Gigaspora margarita]
MKFATFIVAIIAALVTMNFTPYVEAYTVTFINHITKGAYTTVTAYPEGGGRYIDQEECISHCLMHLHVDETYKKFRVEVQAFDSRSSELTNDRDHCVRLH